MSADSWIPCETPPPVAGLYERRRDREIEMFFQFWTGRAWCGSADTREGALSPDMLGFETSDIYGEWRPLAEQPEAKRQWNGLNVFPHPDQLVVVRLSNDIQGYGRVHDGFWQYASSIHGDLPIGEWFIPIDANNLRTGQWQHLPSASGGEARPEERPMCRQCRTPDWACICRVINAVPQGNGGPNLRSTDSQESPAAERCPAGAAPEPTHFNTVGVHLLRKGRDWLCNCDQCKKLRESPDVITILTGAKDQRGAAAARGSETMVRGQPRPMPETQSAPHPLLHWLIHKGYVTPAKVRREVGVLPINCWKEWK